MNDLGWYVLQVHPRKERLARDRIAELRREVFLPLVAEGDGGRRPAGASPLFPGYLFARLSPAAGDLSRVRWAWGVSRLLGYGERPVPVGDEVIALIRSRLDRRGRIRLGGGLPRGKRVRIVRGPLSGLVGVLEQRVSDPAERVHVFLELFHRLTRVEVRAEALRLETAV